MMNWLLKWRLRRAEQRLREARLYREMCESANENYEGLYLDRVLDAMKAERRAELTVSSLQRRLEGRKS